MAAVDETTLPLRVQTGEAPHGEKGERQEKGKERATSLLSSPHNDKRPHAPAVRRQVSKNSRTKTWPIGDGAFRPLVPGTATRISMLDRLQLIRNRDDEISRARESKALRGGSLATVRTGGSLGQRKGRGFVVTVMEQVAGSPSSASSGAGFSSPGNHHKTGCASTASPPSGSGKSSVTSEKGSSSDTVHLRLCVVLPSAPRTRQCKPTDKKSAHTYDTFTSTPPWTHDLEAADAKYCRRCLPLQPRDQADRKIGRVFWVVFAVTLLGFGWFLVQMVLLSWRPDDRASTLEWWHGWQRII